MQNKIIGQVGARNEKARRRNRPGGRVFAHPQRHEHRGRQGQRQAPTRRHRGLRQARGLHDRGRVLRAAVSGADHIDQRPGFTAMLKRIEGNGVRTILVETANRFARDLMVQEVGYAMLKERGIELIAADSPHSFIEDTPTARLIRQVLGAVAEFDKAMTVAKLRGARDRKRATGVKVEGRKSHAELRPEVVSEAKRLYRRSPKTGERRSLREISTELATMGHLGSTGRPFSPSIIKAMVEA